MKDKQDVLYMLMRLQKNEPQNGAIDRGMYFGKVAALKWVLGEREGDLI